MRSDGGGGSRTSCQDEAATASVEAEEAVWMSECAEAWRWGA